MSEDIIPAELERHLKCCTECHDPGKDGGDAIYCPRAEMLFRIFRVSLCSDQPALVH